MDWLWDVVTDGTTLWAGGLVAGVARIYSGAMGAPLSPLPGDSTSPCCAGGMTRIGSNLYWIDPNGDPDATAIFRISTSGGAKTKIYSGFATGQPIVDGIDITTDGTRLYTADAVQGRVHWMNPDGSGIIQIDGNRYGGYFYGEHANYIAVGEGTLFIADSGSSLVGQPPGIYTHSASSASGAFSTLYSGAPFVEGRVGHIAYGAGTLYVTTYGDTIYSIAASGGPMTALTDPLFHNVGGIAYESGSLYVTDLFGGTGRILRVDLAAVPEPATLLLMGAGLAGLGARGLLRRR